MLILKPEDTRIKNAITLLHLLLKNEGISRAELARTTGLTKTTVSDIIRHFLDLGIVEESEKTVKGNVGKNPTPLYIKADATCAIGIHLGRERIRTTIVDGRMKLLFKRKGNPYEKRNFDDIMHSLFENIDSALKEAEKLGRNVKTIGIGIPGPLNAESGVVRKPPKFKGWKDVPLAKMVKGRYSVPVWIENDANVGAVAEKWYGGGKQIKNFMYVLANEGIGAGLIIDDDLYQGTYDYVGEIGHSLFFERGKFRYLEDIAGADLLVKKVKRKGFNVSKITDIVRVLKTKRGSEEVLPIVEKSALWIGTAIINAAHVIGPQTVFIGGKLSKLGDSLLLPVRRMFDKYLFGDQEVEVMLSEIPEEAVSIGAAIYANMKWLEKISTQ